MKDQDEIILGELLQTFISEKTVQEAAYKLTGLESAKGDSGIYYIPGDGDLNAYKMHI